MPHIYDIYPSSECVANGDPYWATIRLGEEWLDALEEELAEADERSPRALRLKYLIFQIEAQLRGYQTLVLQRWWAISEEIRG